MCVCVCDAENLHTSFYVHTVSITSGYTESEAFYNPILWYDRRDLCIKQRWMLDSCAAASYYHQLQAPAVKYMKPEPVTYYHYAEDAECYQNNIAVTCLLQLCQSH